MIFSEAKAALEKRAEGKFHSIGYDLTETQQGKLIAKCSVYLDGYNWHNAPTWNGALSALDKEIQEKKLIAADLTEAPTECIELEPENETNDWPPKWSE